jgi:transcriptional regulator of acetoin/glycerol metabolism
VTRSKFLDHYLRKQRGPHQDLPTLAKLDDEYMHYVLEVTSNDVMAASEILGISPEILFRRLRKFDLWL